MLVKINEIIIGENRRSVNPERVKELAASIQEIGLLNPITITEDKHLVAGLHRIEAYKLLGKTEIEATVVSLDELDAELAQIDENLMRNELTVLERAEQLKRRKEIYEAKYPESKSYVIGGKIRQNSANEIISFARDTASKIGVSPRTVQHEVQIAEDLADEVKEAIRNTDLADNKTELLRLARLDEEEQKEAAKRIAAGEAKSVSEAVQQIKKEQIYTTYLNTARKDSTKWRIYNDSMETINLDEQFDFIITDPPYPKEYLPLYETLSIRANEWLKPTGLMLVMCGQSYLDEILALMTKHIAYYWMAAYLTPGQPTPLRTRQVNCSWKPILIFGNRDYKGKIFGDVFSSDRGEKEFHEWQQSVSGMEAIIKQFCLPGQSILDPFCGTGTTGIAALKYNCTFVGIELDPQTAEVAKGRLSEYDTQEK